jgi:AraC-like DNA-binding protein
MGTVSMGEISQRVPAAVPELEPHFTVSQIAAAWGVSRQSVTRIFQDESGVLKFGAGRFTTLRIPESTLGRVYEQRSAGFVARKVKGRRG